MRQVVDREPFAERLRHQAIWRMETGILKGSRICLSSGLQKIVGLFESLPEQEKRDALISYADQARKWEPKEGETFDLEDIRKDEECTDTVGVFLKVEDEERATFRVTLGHRCRH